MTKKLYELAIDETFEMFLLIKNADVRTAKNGKPFIAFTFQDKSGQMDGKYWSATPEEIEKYQSGRVVFLAGKREIYNGNAQVKITGMRLTREGEPNEARLFMEQAPLTKEEMIDDINQTLFEITCAPMNRVVRFILNKFSQEVFEYPAAKRHHHAFTGGLGFHTVSMLKIAKSLANQYDVINKPLLYAGVILHDLGKVVELSGPVVPTYTLEGKLLGHISIAQAMIYEAAHQLNIEGEEVILLQHLVLSHHGKNEYGSPVLPQIKEAEIIYLIDNIDARMNMFDKALEQVEPGECSKRVFALENRVIYKPKMYD